MKTQWELLKRAVKNNRIPQAMIFSGPKGTGKRETAFQFVRLLQGESDLISIEPQEKQIQIDQIRDLQRALSFKPRFGDFKPVIIDDAHTLNTLAQNCFLKTLEEPPGKALFILLTPYPEMLLPTIRSRCAFLKFFPTEQPKAKDTAEIEALLQKDLSAKFAFAEKFGKKNSEEVQNFLSNLIIYLRNLLLEDLKNSEAHLSFCGAKIWAGEELKQKIEMVENLKFLLSTTNINQRLALENLMLNI